MMVCRVVKWTSCFHGMMQYIQILVQTMRALAV